MFTESEKKFIEKCYFFAENLVSSAGGLLTTWSKTNDKFATSKSARTDLVTQFDTKMEDLIRDGLMNEFPSHKFIGEESSHLKEALGNDPTWIIDPIDGTANFVHGFPAYAISVALVYMKIPVVGLVFNGATGDLYKAMWGTGAFKNDCLIHVSPTIEKEKCLLVTEFGFFSSEKYAHGKFDTLQKIFTTNSSVHGLRALGCASLNLCLVASGLADLYYEWGIHCWDIAAGVLIVTEASGFVRDISGKPLDLMARNVLAGSSKELVDSILTYMPEVQLKRDDEN